MMPTAVSNSSRLPRSIGSSGSSASLNAPERDGLIDVHDRPRRVSGPAVRADDDTAERVADHQRCVQPELPTTALDVGRECERVVRCLTARLAVTA